MANLEFVEKELETLEYIFENQDAVKQRDLSKIVGVSLGMINAIIKRLARKGWLMVRKVNNRNIQYIVSPEGAQAIARRSYGYFKRTIKNVVLYKEAIERIVVKAKRQGCVGIVLIGQSDMDFVLEHVCLRHSIDYIKKQDKSPADGYFQIYSEQYPPDSKSKLNLEKQNIVFITDILMNLKA